MHSLITAPRLFTGLDHTFIDRGAVLVERDRIVAAGRESEIGAPDGPVQRFHIPDGTIVPGLMIVATVLSLNVFGDGLRDALDPRAKIRLEH